MGSLHAELRQILRRLARTPMFTGIILVTLAVGIGANTAIFTVLESVLLKPLPYLRPDELVGVWHAAPSRNLRELSMTPASYFIYREQGRVFDDIGIYQTDAVSVTGVADPEQVRALDVTESVLPILGVAPMLGRGFEKPDVQPGAPDTIMLSFAFWQRKLGGDPSVIGRRITVDGKPREIIGVMPRRFTFLDDEDRGILLPLQLDRATTQLGNYSYQGLARLKPGMTIADANADVARMLPIVAGSFPPPAGSSVEQFKRSGIGPNVRPLMHDVVGDIGTVLWVVMASIGLVLLIACANVANLLLVRAEGRQQELAIRAALGASRGRLAGELLFESLVIGLLGSLAGLAFAYGAIQLLVSMAPAGLPRLGEIGLDAPALLFTLAVSLLASLLVGCVPIFKYARAGTSADLQGGGRTQSQSRERHRARSTLVVVQVGLAFVLLIGSGLMIRTFHALTTVDPGFRDPATVQTFRISIPEADAKEPEQVIRTEEAILHKIEGISGVSGVAVLHSVPMDQHKWSEAVELEDHDHAPGEIPPNRRVKFVSPEAQSVLGLKLVAGKPFSWSDVHNKVPVAMVSERLAREAWHDPAAAIGKHIRDTPEDEWQTIVAVLGDVHDDGVNQDSPTTVYWPLLVASFEGKVQVRRDVTYAIRSPRAGSESLMKEVRQAVWSVDSNLPLAAVKTLDYYSTLSMARTSFTLVMLGLAGGMALLLGTVGLYGVIAYSVEKRTREIGIRMALGAQENQLTRMFVRQGMRLTGAGILAGLIVAVAAVRLLSSLLFRVSSVDPLTYVAVSVGLVAIAALASYLPSRRAAAVDPVEALRSE